jgi:hypothetical protein
MKVPLFCIRPENRQKIGTLMFVFLEISVKAPKNQRKIYVYKTSSKDVLNQNFTKNKGFFIQTSVPKVAYFTDVYKMGILLFLKAIWWNGITPMEQHPRKSLALNSKIRVPNRPKNPQNHMFAE